MKIAPYLTLALCLLLGAAPAAADSIQPLEMNFSRITSNSSQGDQVKINLKVSQVNDHQVLLEFSNLSNIQSVISEIYFQDTNGLISRYQILNNQNIGKVFFEDGAHPSNLPGGNDVAFQTTFATEAKNPSPKYGINPNETLKVYADLKSGVGVATLMESLANQGFRIGAHVQSIGGRDSDSFVNTPPGGSDTVPEPATVVLLGSGLLASWAYRRRKARKSA